MVAVKRATAVIPISFTTAGDPVATGLVASLARPGDSLTGLSNQTAELAGKRLELLREIIPDSAPVGNFKQYREIHRRAGDGLRHANWVILSAQCGRKSFVLERVASSEPCLPAEMNHWLRHPRCQKQPFQDSSCRSSVERRIRAAATF